MAKILLVEDDVQLSRTVRGWLSVEQHSVETVDSGQKALDMLAAYQYDLIVLDWELPDMCGPDICKDYRHAGGTTPVIMLTGRNAIEDKEKGFEFGADDYLTKPFHFKELVSRIKALLRRSAVSAVQAPAARQKESITDGKYCDTCGGYFQVEETICPADGARLLPTKVKVDQLVGTTIGDRYVVMAPIAKGGMSMVYQAWHKFLNRLVAIKFLLSRYAEDPRHLRRFQLEAQAASALQHPNIISILDFGMSDTKPYMVMDFINGSSLHELVQSQGYVPLAQAVNMFIQACGGLAHAHEAGIVHRDLKPSNLMIQRSSDGTEVVKIVDFGIAKLLPESGFTVERLTETGECFGTSAYMSPEQCMGRGLDTRSDIYSFGCVMYETLVGQPPFKGDNALDTIQKQIYMSAEPLSSVRSNLTFPLQIEQMVFKALEKDPACRYQSMHELREELEKLVDQMKDSGTEPQELPYL